jgi:radical SAM superfamily enzyme YgiQ (UPF0313 family)
MELAKKSGCKGLFIGLESVVQNNNVKYKKLKTLEDTQQSIKKILKMGIVIQASVIFGLDEDTQKTFKQTIKFLIRNRISIASINILTPYPGTKIHKEFKEEGRLLHEKWEYYDHHTVVFKPKNMSPLELQISEIKAKASFNSVVSILKRFVGNLRMPIIFLAANIGYRKHAMKEKKRLRKFETHLGPDSCNNMGLDVFIKEEPAIKPV